MRQKTNFITTKDGVATVSLRDRIGQGIDGKGISGALVSQEIQFLDQQDPDIEQIDVKINSGGGIVMDAISIYNAIKDADASTRVIIEGIAASSASIIALAGDRVIMNEMIGRIMVHEVRDLNGQDEKGTEEFNQILKNLLQSRADWSDERTRSVMSEETWFDAQKALEEGLVDDTYSGQEGAPEPQIENVFNPYELQNIVNEAIDSEKNTKGKPSETETMTNTKIASVLGLDEQASEDKVLEKVNELSNKVNELESQVSQKDNEIGQLKTELKQYEQQKGEKLINDAIAAGKIQEDQKDQLLQDYQEAPQMVERMLNATMPKKPEDASVAGKMGERGSEKTNGTSGEKGGGVDAKLNERAQNLPTTDFRKLDKEHPETLEDLFHNDRELYDHLYEMKYGRKSMSHEA